MVRSFVPAALFTLARASNSGGADSVTQVRDTLRTLLNSVQGEGRDVEEGLQKTQRWCDATLFDLKGRSSAAAAQLSEMKLDLKEGEAAAQEADGSVQQVRADIALVQHTINQTEEMRRVWLHEEKVEKKSAELAQKGGQLSSSLNAALLQSRQVMEKQFKSDKHAIGELIENKKQSLTSLEGELEVVLLAHAQVQARAAEAKRRITDRDESAVAEEAFTAALTTDCNGRGNRAAARLESRTKATSAIERVVDALQQVSAQPIAEQAAEVSKAADAADTTDEDDSDSGPESFLQTGESQISAEDVLELLGGGPALPPRPSVTQDPQIFLQRPRPHARAAISQPKIGQILSQMKSASASAAEQKHWCAREHEDNKLALRLAQDLVSQISAEIDAHSDAEAQLSESLTNLDDFRGLLNSTMKNVADAAKKEVTLLAHGEKDKALAGKILNQAINILDNLQETGGLAKMHISGGVVGLLKEAKSAVEQHSKNTQSLQQDAVASAKDLIQKAHAVAVVQDRERSNTEELRDEHISQRGAFLETKEAYTNEVSQANTYLSKLNEECSASAIAHQQETRATQVHALEDAKAVLEGKKTLARDDAFGLRGSSGGSASAQPKSEQSLSPLERAAMEIGVAVDK